MNSLIAVTGAAGVFPDAPDAGAFIKNLAEGRDVTSTVSTEDFGADPDLFYHPEKGRLDRCYSLRGGFVRDFKFDSEGFALPSELIDNQDIMYKWSLQAAREALRDAGLKDGGDFKKRCGTVFGNLSFPSRSSHEYFNKIHRKITESVGRELLGRPDFELPPLQRNSGHTDYNPLVTSSPAALVTAALDLQGPHFSLDAACASSLYAVKLACDELLSGRADLMLAGAVAGADPLFITMGFSIFRAYAAAGTPGAPLDKRSGGLISAEGAGVVVLKRLEDALRDGDRIYACIAGAGLSNDGAGKFLLSPNPKGQRLAFERAYTAGPFTPHDIDYLECHATGTPLGDVTEITSIENFYGDKIPLIGSVKSNTGHLLTAAGMTSLIKVLFGMRDGRMYPTPQIEVPVTTPSGRLNNKHIVTETTEWPEKPGFGRVAGVNAFGFGGTNAHLVLCQNPPAAAVAQTTNKNRPACKMAVIGADAHFGPCKNGEEFRKVIYDAAETFGDLPEGRWRGFEKTPAFQSMNFPDNKPPKGSYITDFQLDLIRYKIQPNEAEKLEPQQTVLLKTADRALLNAGFSPEEKGRNTAVITAMEADPALHAYLGRWDLNYSLPIALEKLGISADDPRAAELETLFKNMLCESSQADNSAGRHTGFIGNIMTARVSSLWDFTGPSFTVSSGENSAFKALEIAGKMLSSGEADSVLVSAVDMAGGFEHILASAGMADIAEGSGFSFLKGAAGRYPGEGAAALVLKKLEDAEADGDRILAVIDAVGINQSIDNQSLIGKKDFLPQTDSAKLSANFQKTIDAAGISAADIGLLEASASGIPQQDAAETTALNSLFTGPERRTAIGSVKANIGHTFSASGLASVLKTVYALDGKFIPGVPKAGPLKEAEQFAGSGFYVPGRSAPWIATDGNIRRAAVSGLSHDGTDAQVILSEYLG